MNKGLNTKIKDKKAITLIALVITIVVLIILAAVAINLTLGNNGIFTRAKTAKEQYQNAEGQEKFDIAKASNEIDSYVQGNRDVNLTDEVKNYIDEKVAEYNTTTTTQLTNVPEGVTLTRNKIRKSGKVVSMDIIGNYSSLSSTQYTIGCVPEGYRSKGYITSFMRLGSSDWDTKSIGYLYLDASTGNVIIADNNSTSNKYFSINISYVIE